jgi:hypothetical protein
MTSFNFDKLSERGDASTFFRNMGVPVDDHDDHVKLLQAARGYLNAMRNQTVNVRRRANTRVEEAFLELTGESIDEVSSRYDPNHAYNEETHGDMMPRADRQLDRAKQLNMKSFDEIIQMTTEGALGALQKLGGKAIKGYGNHVKNDPKLMKSLNKTKASLSNVGDTSTGMNGVGAGMVIGAGIDYANGGDDESKQIFTPESIDPNSFEMMSGKPVDKHYVTSEDLIQLGGGVPQEELLAYAQDAVLDDLVGGAFVTDPVGNVEYTSSEESCDDFTLTADWFADATQDLVDRASTGECWQSIVCDLSQRFAGFFEGSYHAMEFAAAAFSRRAMDLGMIENQMMVESFDRTGGFNDIVPVNASFTHRGHTISLNPNHHDDIKILKVSFIGNMIKYIR